MEAARTSETLVNFYQTTRCYNPEDSNLHTHRRENLKSYLHNEKLKKHYNLYSSPNITRVIKLIKMRFAGHVASTGEIINACSILVGKP
jgi:hypothetical protein